MKKMFKAAASLAVGCALLSTSAFAALTGEVVKTDTGATVSLTGYAEKAQSTILVLKDVEELSADIADSAIAYINQAEATDGTIIYDVKVSGDGTYSVFVGGSDQTEAKKLESFVISSAPANDYITSADTDKGTITANANSTTAGTAWAFAGYSTEVSVKLNEDIYANAGDATTGYTLKVVDVNGNDVENATVYYSTERGKYVALIPDGVTEYKFEIVSGGNTNTVIARYGDALINTQNAVNATDVALITRYIKGLVSMTELQKLTSDVALDGKVNATDVAAITRVVKQLATSLPVVTK